jgi:ATP adenylyltransferase
MSLSLIHEMARRALASGALQPIETDNALVDDAGVRFIVRTVSSLARKEAARSAPAPADPLGDYDPELFVADLPPSHYVLLNKFPLVAGHVLIVRRRFERQERMLDVEDFAALLACLDEVDGLGFYNGGIEAGASQARKHLQLVPLPLAPEGQDAVPMERTLLEGPPPAFRHAFSRIEQLAPAGAWHALYRGLLQQVGIAGIASADGEVQSASYNLLVRRGWMLVVPRSRASFESISVNALGFAGSLFVRTRTDLQRASLIGPMQVLRAVTCA